MEALTVHDLSPGSIPTGEDLMDRGRAPFKFWVPATRALVVGHSQEVHREIRAEAALADGIPAYRRMGGGGAVLLSPACVCVGLRFAKAKGRTLHQYFEAGSDLIRRAVFAAIGVDLVSRGLSDLAARGLSMEGYRKVVGCSLYMPRDYALYLASILVCPDYGEIDRYLAHPSREPDYRGGRDHRDFLVGLSELDSGDLEPRHLLPHLDAALEAGLLADLDWPQGG